MDEEHILILSTYLYAVNFLAHLALSGDREDIIVGNFMGDAVKGRLEQKYSGELLVGLKLHRFIDQYTDEHSLNVDARGILRSVTGKYAGVALDLTYDHFLAQNFEDIIGEDLIDFESRMIELLSSKEEVMPERTIRFFKAMSEGKWLSGYANEMGFKQVCEGLDRRISRKSGLKFVPDLVKKERKSLQNIFYEFFPTLQYSSKEKLLEWGK